MGEVQVPPALLDAVDSLKEAVKAGRTDIFRKLLDACETCELYVYVYMLASIIMHLFVYSLILVCKTYLSIC